MRDRALLRTATAALMVGIVAACGGPSPTAPIETTSPSIEAAATGSVCDVVPDMDVLVGRTAVAAPSSYFVGASERCLWVYVTDPSRYVALTVGEATSHADTIANFGDGEVIAGLGEDARWWEANRTLSLIDGDRSLQVDLQLDDAADPKALAVSIAGAALD